MKPEVYEAQYSLPFLMNSVFMNRKWQTLSLCLNPNIALLVFINNTDPYLSPLVQKKLILFYIKMINNRNRKHFTQHLSFENFG